MIRKALTALVAAGALIGALATTATASPRHSDFYVKVGNQWVAEDQLTAGQIDALDNEPNCAPLQWAVAVDQVLTVRPGGNPVPVLAVADGRDVISTSDATTAQLDAANFDQVGLTGIPSFLGPTGYGVTSSGAYYCLS